MMKWLRSGGTDARQEKARLRWKLVLGVSALLVIGFQARSGWAQGCIVARSTQQVINPLSTTSEGVLKPESQGGYLAPHQWELTIGFRHQYSYMHFVGLHVSGISEGTAITGHE